MKMLIGVIAGLLTLIALASAEGQAFVGHVSGHPGLTSEDIAVKCLENSMEISIPKEKLKRIKSGDRLYLIDPACTAADNGTHFIGTPWLKDCGTSKRYQYDGIVYSNVLKTKYPKPEDVETKCPIIKIKFACFYPFMFAAAVRTVKVEEKTVECEHMIGIGPVLQGGIISLAKARTRLRMRQRTVQCPAIIGIGDKGSLGIRQRTKLRAFTTRQRTVVCKELENAGSYGLRMMVFSDELFTKPITGQHVAEKEFVDVFYEIRLIFGDNNVEIMPSTCYATPDKDPANKIKYYFLKNGCILDNTVQFFATGPWTSRFSIRSFKFAGKEISQFYIHCQVDVCQLNDADSSCRRGCMSDNSNRIKRHSKWGLRVERKIIRPPELTSVCLDGRMKILMKKSLYSGVAKHSFHMNDKDCTAKDNGTHFLFDHMVGHCGAMRSDGKTQVVYRNMVYLEGNNQYTAFFPMEVSCSFSKAQSESTRAKFLLQRPKRFFQIKNIHPYRLQFKVLIGRSVKQSFVKSPVDITTKVKGQLLDIVSSAKRGGITIRTKHCAFKQSVFSKEKAQIIHKGCPASKNVLFYEHSGAMEILRLVMNPKAIPKGKNGHLTCTIIVCGLKDPECSTPCNLHVPVTSTGILSRRRRSTGHHVDISCGQHAMTVTLSKTTLPPVDASNLRLRDASCRAFENATHFILSTPLGSCGTGIIQDSGTLIYTNQITQDISQMVIIRQRLVNIPFRCLYRATTSATSGQFRLKPPKLLLVGPVTGIHEVNIRMFTDATFTKLRNDALLLVDSDQDMYFEVDMGAPQAKIAIVLDECYGKPTDSQNEREKYVFIRDGCPLDDTVKIHDSPSYTKARFSSKPFHFSDKPASNIMVNCLVSACNPNDPQARCFRECSR